MKQHRLVAFTSVLALLAVPLAGCGGSGSDSSSAANVMHQKMNVENRPEKTLFIITTDGMENSSVEYSLDQVKQLIERQKERDHWEFLFLGANIDAVQTAGRMGIEASRAVNFHADKPGMRKNFCVLVNAISSFAESEELNENWAEDIQKDFESCKQEVRFSK